MKKLIRILCILVLVFGLSACGDKETVTTVCTTEYEGFQIENTMISVDDKVQSITYKNVTTVGDDLIPYLEDAAETYRATLDGVKGVTYEYTIDGNTITEYTTLDYTKADMSELVELKMLEEVDGEVPDYISLDNSIQNMKDIGCTCVEK